MPADKRTRAGACKTCRVRKRRCLPVAADPTGPCQMCASLNLDCTIAKTRHHELNNPVVNHLPAARSPPRLVEIRDVDPIHTLPPQSLLNDLIDLYFRRIHDGPHTLFHEATFNAENVAGRVHTMLLLAISALSARFSASTAFYGIDPRLRGQPYANQAMKMLQASIIYPSLETIQCCVLMSQYLGGEGDSNGKYIYSGIARLHAQTLHLWDCVAVDSIVYQEIKRRTWLSVLITDNWSALDLATTPSIRAESYESSFPSLNEVDFFNLAPGTESKDVQLSPSSLDASLWKQMAKYLSIPVRINSIIADIGSGRTSISSEDESIAGIAKDLDRWENDLPLKLKYNLANLQRHRIEGFGLTFLAMHIGYFHFRQLLYFPFLDTRNVKSEKHQKYTELCMKSARSVSDIAVMASQMDDCRLLYFLIGHILVVSSSIHLYTLLFSSTEETDQARRHLITNFETLMELKKYWPVVDVSVNRLREFQNDCRLSMTESFALDHWMLKFLMEHSTVLNSDRRNAQETQSNSENSDAISKDEPSSRKDNVNTLSAICAERNWSDDVLVENALSWLLD